VLRWATLAKGEGGRECLSAAERVDVVDGRESRSRAEERRAGRLYFSNR
jgi:hypothetical protein